jgi:glycosyltransferase involved in cell wall biosynthesis
MTRPRVLLSAYQCAPNMGSVSQIGWEWYSRLSSRTAVTLVTHIRNRAALEKAGSPLGNSRILYIDTEWFAGPLYRTANRLFRRSEHSVFLISSFDFYVYDWQATRLARKIGVETWDVIHAPTPVSPAASTRMCRLGPPLVIGPLNGGLQSPKAFAEIMRDDSGWLYPLRQAGRLMNVFTGCSKRAALILSATASTDATVRPQDRQRVRRMIENGVELSTFAKQDDAAMRRASGKLRVLFVGRLIPVKGVSMMLDAVQRVRKNVDIHLTIVGDGPLRRDIEDEVKRRELSDVVHLTGNLPLRDVAAHYREADLFCLPSVRESGGAVLLEAMACGVPVAAVAYGGPAEIVDEQVGRLLPANGPEALVQALVQMFEEAAAEPEIWRRKGIEGRRRAEQRYGWEAKIDEALSLYKQVIEGRNQ